ncbi:copper amine oxidase N-terminal domain-containing protein [Paenibacillus foliorum]|nr:copper amine oxidase N-terminal domain-containing protein [Paenibacillus foliorum]
MVTRSYLSLFFALILLLSTTVTVSASSSGTLYGGFSAYSFSDLTSQSTMSNTITLYTVPKGSDFYLYGADHGSAVLQFYKVISSNFNPNAVKNGVPVDGKGYNFTGVGDSDHIWNGEGDDPSEKLNYRFSTTGYYYLVTSKNTSRSVTMIVHVVDSKSVESSIRVTIDGKPVSFSQPPIMEQGNVLVPLRPIFDVVTTALEGNMNSELKFDELTRKVRLEYGDLYFILKPGDEKIETNTTTAGQITLEVAPKIIDGTTYVPIRALSNFYNFDVSWDNETRTVDLKK